MKVADKMIEYSNKRLQLDNLQAVRFAVSLSLHFTAKRTAYKLRLKRALALKTEKPNGHRFNVNKNSEIHLLEEWLGGIKREEYI